MAGGGLVGRVGDPGRLIGRVGGSDLVIGLMRARGGLALGGGCGDGWTYVSSTGSRGHPTLFAANL